ncbi:MAG: thiolase family protein [Gammaproteobacteria bacterium]|nr:thiolase family protein [Gammaproteobacteria bacterium]MCP5458264.1 thiolase family protein [Gammaproteobacteria bacterium]
MSYTYQDVWLVNGQRTGFADYNSTLREISPIDLGIAAARAALECAQVPATDIGQTFAGNMAQSSFDAYYLARHIGLYAGVPQHRPALQVQRLCCSGFEAILQGADAMQLGRIEAALCVGTESMSRNPIAAYTMRSGYRMGKVDFRDFLWEATLDTASNTRMGDTAENLAKQYGISREEVDEFALQSFTRAIAARDGGFHAGEIFPLVNQSWQPEKLQPRGIKLPRKVTEFATDEHIKPTTLEVLGKIRPAFGGGVQTGGNSSAIVDGAAGVVLVTGDYLRKHGLKPLGRVVAGVSVGVDPSIMGIGPAPAIRGALEAANLNLGDIDRFEINEAFGAQYLAVEKDLGLDRNKVNVNGGAIAIGHPLGATGVRCTLTVARELKRCGGRYGIASACAGGGQGTAIIIENTDS